MFAFLHFTSVFFLLINIFFYTIFYTYNILSSSTNIHRLVSLISNFDLLFSVFLFSTFFYSYFLCCRRLVSSCRLLLYTTGNVKLLYISPSMLLSCTNDSKQKKQRENVQHEIRSLGHHFRDENVWKWKQLKIHKTFLNIQNYILLLRILVQFST